MIGLSARWIARRGASLLGVGTCLLVGCAKEVETSWSQYNSDDATVAIEVGLAEETEAVTVELVSNTGSVILGTGSVTPGGGPIGTVHTMTVEVSDDYASDIGRVSVRLDAGDRGEDEYDLDADATGEGYWVIQLESVGDEGETRTDTVTFRLWAEETTSEEDSA